MGDILNYFAGDTTRILEALAVSLGMIGSVFIAKKKIYGFYILNLGNIFAFLFFFNTSAYMMLAQTIYFTMVNFYGIKSWANEHGKLKKLENENLALLTELSKLKNEDISQEKVAKEIKSGDFDS